MTQDSQSEAKQSSTADRAYAWLGPIWLLYVLTAFFVIRILGSGLAHRLLSVVQIKLGR